MRGTFFLPLLEERKENVSLLSCLLNRYVLKYEKVPLNTFITTRFETCLP